MKIQIQLKSSQLTQVLIRLFGQPDNVQIEIDTHDIISSKEEENQLVELEVLMRPA